MRRRKAIGKYGFLFPVGLGIGVALGVAIHNVGVGLAIGAAIGTICSLLGAMFEQRESRQE